MNVEKVGPEYVGGMLAFNNLVSMIEEAIHKAGILLYSGFPRFASWDFKGFYVAGNDFWCGVYYDDPLTVRFKMMHRKDFDAKLVETPSYPVDESKHSTWFCLPLKDIDFFAMDSDEQLGELTRFVKTAYAEAQQMRVKRE